MRLAVLSAEAGWHVRDLQRAATLRGHLCEPVDLRRLSAGVAYGTHPSDQMRFLEGFDAVLVRTVPPGSLEQIVFRMDLLHMLHERGTHILNPPRALETCVDKYLTTARLAAAGLPVPPTLTCQTADAALEAFERLGGDVVVKPLFGSEGRGMVRISDPELAWRTFRAIERTRDVLYVQQFIAHPGWDLRVFVLGGRVLAGMRRTARGDWRTNVAQGGRAEPAHVNEGQARLALRAAEVLGAPLAGVDLLPTSSGEWLVLEVNAVPGWRALAPTCNVDVAAAIIDYVQRTVER